MDFKNLIFKFKKESIYFLIFSILTFISFGSVFVIVSTTDKALLHPLLLVFLTSSVVWLLMALKTLYDILKIFQKLAETFKIIHTEIKNIRKDFMQPKSNKSVDFSEENK